MAQAFGGGDYYGDGDEDGDYEDLPVELNEADEQAINDVS